MKNKAKCRLCGDIIESVHSDEVASCKCGAISVHGGDAMYCSVLGDWTNFIRVDDNGNEIVPTIKEKAIDESEATERLATKQDLIDALTRQYEYIDASYDVVKWAAPTTSDISAMLQIIVGIFKRL